MVKPMTYLTQIVSELTNAWYLKSSGIQMFIVFEIHSYFLSFLHSVPVKI
jgi:hypothetical protein